MVGEGEDNDDNESDDDDDEDNDNSKDDDEDDDDNKSDDDVESGGYSRRTSGRLFSPVREVLRRCIVFVFVFRHRRLHDDAEEREMTVDEATEERRSVSPQSSSPHL